MVRGKGIIIFCTYEKKTEENKTELHTIFQHSYLQSKDMPRQHRAKQCAHI